MVAVPVFLPHGEIVTEEIPRGSPHSSGEGFWGDEGAIGGWDSGSKTTSLGGDYSIPVPVFVVWGLTGLRKESGGCLGCPAGVWGVRRVFGVSSYRRA